MSFERTLVLGAIAGFTIFLGLPVSRVGAVSARARGLLSVFAAGILLFIFWDVMSGAADLVEGALASAKDGGGWSTFAERLVLLSAGLLAGSVGLAQVERRLLRVRILPPAAGGSVDAAASPGLDVAALNERAAGAALRLALLIAIAIGLHNFSEGLAIGTSARSGEVGLAGTLIVGFALHNATEGFGIVGPLDAVRPSWRWLIAVGLIGGGPTFVGAIVGWNAAEPALELLFFALAAGAILYVVGQIWTSAARRLTSTTILAGLAVGYLVGLASDLVITYGGG